jgi:hypothetical protein
MCINVLNTEASPHGMYVLGRKTYHLEVVAGIFLFRVHVAVMQVCLQCGVQAGKRTAGGVPKTMEDSWWGKMDVGSMSFLSLVYSFLRA